MTHYSTAATVDSTDSPKAVLSVSAYQRSENGSVSFFILNRIKTKLGNFYDEIDEVLSGLRGPGLCHNAPETLSDDEGEAEFRAMEEAELGALEGPERESCGRMYRDVVTVCHSTRTYSPTMEEEKEEPVSAQCCDIVDNLTCQQNRTDSDSDSDLCDLQDEPPYDGSVQEICTDNLASGQEYKISNTIVANQQGNETKTMETLNLGSPDHRDKINKQKPYHVDERLNITGSNQNFEFEMVSTCFNPDKTETSQKLTFSPVNQEIVELEESRPLLQENGTNEIESFNAKTSPRLIQHLIPSDSSAGLTNYHDIKSPLKAPPPPTMMMDWKKARNSSADCFEASSLTPSPERPASSPVQFMRILSRSPRPGSQLTRKLSASSEHFSLHSTEDSTSFENHFFHQTNSKLGEFFQNFNKPASPVTKLLNITSSKPESTNQSTLTELSRSKHCVLSRDWADYSVEDTGFNINTLTESEYISSGKDGERYTKITELGAGGFGKVYLAEDNDYREKVVLKQIELSKVRLDDVAEEIAILDRYPHENIMKLLDHFSTTTHYCMVYELQSRVSLFEYLRLAGKQDEFEGKIILRQVVDALEWLHDNMIVHGDIKDENMIIQSKTRSIILIDFGSARIIKDKYEPITFRGTRVYSPPEAVSGDVVFGHSQDIWTVGTFVYVLLNNKRPFVDDQEILNACLPYPRFWSDGAKDFVRQCLNREYLDRPTIKLLKYHPWMQS